MEILYIISLLVLLINIVWFIFQMKSKKLKNKDKPEKLSEKKEIQNFSSDDSEILLSESDQMIEICIKGMGRQFEKINSNHMSNLLAEISKKLFELNDRSAEIKGKDKHIRFFIPKDRINNICNNAKENIIVTDKSDQQSKILIVDDELINLQVLGNYLKLKDYDIIKADNGFDALKLIEENMPDLLILDIMMPKMSGYDVCKRIRENYTEKELPILILSAKDHIQDIVTGLELGANDYISKPLKQEELLTKIELLLKMKEYGGNKQKKPHYELKDNDKNIIQDVKAIEAIVRVILNTKDVDSAIQKIFVIFSIILKEKLDALYYFKYYKDSKSFNLETYCKFDQSKIKMYNDFSIRQISLKDIDKIKQIFFETERKKYFKIFKNENENFWQKLKSTKTFYLKNTEKLNKELKKVFQTKNLLVYSIRIKEDIYACFLFDMEKLSEIYLDLINFVLEDINYYFEKMLLEEKMLQEAKNDDFRCSKCKSKLSEYKGNIDFLEIKCPVCNTLNKLSTGFDPCA